MKRRGRYALAALALAALAWGIWRWQAGRAAQEAAPIDLAPLFTGKEPRRRVKLYFASVDKPGFASESAEIFATASRTSQLKQVLRLLFAGPKSKDAGSAFPGQWSYREVFLGAEGLAVVDLDAASVAGHPGGTSSEYVSLHTLVRTLIENFKEVRHVQVLVGGEVRESLAGHLDISGPLNLGDF